LTRMVETNNDVCDRINAPNVNPLRTLQARQASAQLCARICAITYEGDDVLDLKREVEYSFGRMAVFAAVSRP